MSAPLSETVLVALRGQLATLTGAILFEGPRLVADLPDNALLLLVIDLPHDPAGDRKQRWHLNVLVYTRSKYVPSTVTATAYVEVLTRLAALLTLIDSAGFRTAMKNAGAENTRRGAPSIWGKVPALAGEPAGAAVTISIDYVE